jgi:hypothetical protein
VVRAGEGVGEVDPAVTAEPEEGKEQQADVVHEAGAGRSRLEAHIHTKGRNAVPRLPDFANSLKLGMKAASRLSDFGCSFFADLAVFERGVGDEMAPTAEAVGPWLSLSQEQTVFTAIRVVGSLALRTAAFLSLSL